MVSIDIVKKIAEVSGVELLENEPLSKHTGFRTGGPCAAMLFPTSEKQLTDVVAGLRLSNIVFTVLGLGSNCLARDEGYDGVVLSMKKYGAFNDSLLVDLINKYPIPKIASKPTTNKNTVWFCKIEKPAPKF